MCASLRQCHVGCSRCVRQTGTTFRCLTHFECQVLDTGDLIPKLLNTKRQGRPFFPDVPLLACDVNWDEFRASCFDKKYRPGFFPHGITTVSEYILSAQRNTRTIVTNAGVPTRTIYSTDSLVAEVTAELDGKQAVVSVNPIIFLPVEVREYELRLLLSPGRVTFSWIIHPLCNETFEASVDFPIKGYWDYTFELQIV